ncbi:hypothetical protein APR11_000570 [Nocardia amikacinitolerans]|nr:hypothetical protein [Nocardia amikacinitolerans]
MADDTSALSVVTLLEPTPDTVRGTRFRAGPTPRDIGHTLFVALAIGGAHRASTSSSNRENRRYGDRV